MREFINLLERVQDQNMWFNARTGNLVKVREDSIVNTVRNARDRFELDDEFVNQQWSEEALMAKLLAQTWVHTQVMAGTTILRSATEQYARLAFRHQYLHVPLKSVMIEVGVDSITNRVELHGEDEAKAWMLGK